MSNLTDILSGVGTAVGAVVAIYSAWYAYRSNVKQAKEIVRLRVQTRQEAEEERAEAKRQADQALAMQVGETRRQQEETRRQARIAYEHLLAYHRQEVRQWADQVIDAAGCAISLCYAFEIPMVHDEFMRERASTLKNISSLLDKGRIFFPNVDHDKRGLHKVEAYRGLRQPVLNRVYDVYRIVVDMRMEDCRKHADDIVRIRRAFVTEVQRYIDPRSQQKRLKELAGDISDDEYEDQAAELVDEE